jgi:hypothetical protein
MASASRPAASRVRASACRAESVPGHPGRAGSPWRPGSARAVPPPRRSARPLGRRQPGCYERSWCEHGRDQAPAPDLRVPAHSTPVPPQPCPPRRRHCRGDCATALRPDDPSRKLAPAVWRSARAGPLPRRCGPRAGSCAPGHRRSARCRGGRVPAPGRGQPGSAHAARWRRRTGRRPGSRGLACPARSRWQGHHVRDPARIAPGPAASRPSCPPGCLATDPRRRGHRPGS